MGEFSISSSINSTNVKTNDAVTIKLVISGTGNLKLIGDPEVKFPDDFEVYDPKVDNKFRLTSAGLSGSKVIEYLAIPRNAGTFKIPAVKFSYYDIKSCTYKILTTEEYELHVEKGEGNAAQTIANFTNKEDLKVLNEDIRFIKQNDVTLSQKGDFFFDSMLYWLLYLVPGVAFIIFFIIYRNQIAANANVANFCTKKANKDAADSIFAERMKSDPQAGSNLFSRWRQKQDIRQSYYAAARSGTAAQTAGGKAASNGASAARSGVEQAVEKGKTAVSTALKGLVNAAKGNAHVLVIVGVFLLLILMVMSGFSSCGILFSGGTQVSGQTMYSAEDRDIRGAEQDYKKLEKELDKKIKRTPTDHPGYNEYQYHLDPIEHDPWQLTSFLTTLYDDYTRSEVQGKLKETFKKQYKLTTWVEVQIRYKTVWVISPAGIPVPTQVPYEYKIFHTKLVNRGLEVVIREELDNDQWKRYEIFQDTLGGRPYLFNGGLPPGGSDGSGTPGIDYQIPAEALTDSEFAAIYKEAQKYVGTPYVWGGSTPETGFDCSGYVCWVYNQNGYDVGRTTANGLWNKSQHISEADAKPGDLVFFKGTYDTPGMSHTGIYLGNDMMVSAGDPIKYANIHSSYWEKHLAGFGRLSK